MTDESYVIIGVSGEEVGPPLTPSVLLLPSDSVPICFSECLFVFKVS